MKIKVYILIGLLTGMFTSCNNWLDVKPETEMTLEEIYAEQQGFQDALIGSYLNLKNRNAYGEQLVYGTIEILAQHWDLPANSVEEQLANFNYVDKDVQGDIEDVYFQLYKVIASVNVLLENIDAKSDIFEEGMFEVIKGEALAMRAYCHFDLLRLFGPMPTKTNSNQILPYVKTVSTDYHVHHTYQEFIKLLEEDLLLAEQLLGEADPIIPREEVDGKSLSVSAENFLQARECRFNYYAVKALEARFYLWLGGAEDKGKAYQCASELIAAKDAGGNLLFTLGSPADISNMEYSFPKEHILAIDDYTLADRAEGDFTVNATYSKAKDVLSPDLYPSGTTDIRYTGLWEEYTGAGGGKSYSIKKFIYNDETIEKVESYSRLPLMRLAEMYFIAMECGSLAEANMLYEEFCISRDIEFVELQDNAQLEETLIQEYNKEFYAEGQAFYAFKRLAVEDILWAKFPGNEDSYVVPLPLNEVNYGK